MVDCRLNFFFKKVNGITRLLFYEKSLVWTSRPMLNCKSDFILYPSDIDAKYLNNNEKQRMNRYIKDANEILDKRITVLNADKNEKK